MRKMVKRLLKKYKYPPEDYDFAINTVISQCELWTDNADMPESSSKIITYNVNPEQSISMAADKNVNYDVK